LGAKIVYGRLCRYAGEDGWAYPSIESLATEVGIRETQARKYLRELMQKRFVGCEPRTDETGRQTSNRYFFLWHEAFDGAIATLLSVGEPHAGEKAATFQVSR
jgi:hypothetical protein